MAVLRIVFADQDLVVIDKPSGFHVHPPEDSSIRIGYAENCLALLRDQIGKYVYPVHRIDRGTSGLVIFALSSEMAREISRQFSAREVEKTYAAICRGWPKSDRFRIEFPLENDLDRPSTPLPCETEVEVVKRARIAEPIGKFPETRFSLVWASPRTGRTHQIRRHLRRMSHPLLGDSVYGDGDYNRWVRGLFAGRNVLFLKAYALRFRHPRTGETIELRSRWSSAWRKMFELGGVTLWRDFPPNSAQK